MEATNEQNDNLTSCESVFPPEVWLSVLSFLDWRDVKLKTVCKLFSYALKKVENLDMKALWQTIQETENHSKNRNNNLIYLKIKS